MIITYRSPEGKNILFYEFKVYKLKYSFIFTNFRLIDSIDKKKIKPVDYVMNPGKGFLDDRNGLING